MKVPEWGFAVQPHGVFVAYSAPRESTVTRMNTSQNSTDEITGEIATNSPDQEFKLVSKPIRERFPYRQVIAVEEEYRDYWIWLVEEGKDPDRNIGLAPTAVKPMFTRTRQFHLFAWNQIEKFTLRFTHAYADRYELALDEDRIRTAEDEPYTEGSKRKLQQAVQKYFLYLSCTRGGDPWTPTITFHQSEYDRSDYLTLAERESVYNASLAYEDLGRYNDLCPTERDRRKSFLAQKLGKPKSEVTPEDFETVRKSWKIVSLISVSLDIGPRPILFGRVVCDWYKPQKGVLQIPKEESPKNDAYWEVGLSTRSIQALNRWLEQRATIPKYDDTGMLWLNREGNSYNSGSLNYLLNNLLEEAKIDQTNRKLTWYSIRRSTGTYLTYFQSLAYAKQQLRHKSLESTLIYTEIPVEARKDALDQLIGAFGNIGVTNTTEESSDPLEVIQCI